MTRRTADGVAEEESGSCGREDGTADDQALIADGIQLSQTVWRRSARDVVNVTADSRGLHQGLLPS